jgi:GT2 family glycosyltransferase
LLNCLDRCWYSQHGVQDLPLSWRQHPSTVEATSRLLELLQQEVARQDGPWAINASGTSLLLPLWRKVAAELNLPLKLLLNVREPSEALTWLLAKDLRASGMNFWRSQQLWWRHTSQAVLDGQDLPLAVIHHRRWRAGLTTPEAHDQVQKLAFFCESSCLGSSELLQVLSSIPEQRLSSPWIPHRLIPIHPWLRQLDQLLLGVAQGTLQRRSLEHWLTHSPQPITLPLSNLRHGHSPPQGGDPLDPSSHPWAASALALQGQHHRRARNQLEYWCQLGTLPDEDLDQLRFAPGAAFPPEHPPLSFPTAAAAKVHIISYGEPWSDWQVHAWLQHLPLPLDPRRCILHQPEEIDAIPGSCDGNDLWLGLHLQPLIVSAQRRQLLQLAALGAVFDRDSETVAQLRHIGVKAHQLESGAANDWLLHPDDDLSMARLLGLPSPAALMGDPPGVLCLGSGGPEWERNLRHPYWCLPGIDRLRIDGFDQARILASWLNRCHAAGLQFVRIDPREAEMRLDGYRALTPPSPSPSGWMPRQFFRKPLAVEALEEELDWRREGCPQPAQWHTPTPMATCLWEQESGVGRAAVCISLHNYGDRIETALESVRLQSLKDLELNIVDDASTDGGEQVVLRWLERHGHRFVRVRLSRHQRNGGLASARNTAFADIQAPWCFVLDADNRLLPDAVEQCLKVAEVAPPSAAVVHSLVEVIGEEPGIDPNWALISIMSWQRNQFIHGNYVDAMALVRVSAWRKVGGYTHIPGGWEDFDFWCKLIDAGMHGVLCPQRLACYHRHGASMITTTTDRHIRQISRALQVRHPWLSLPMAGRDI